MSEKQSFVIRYLGEEAFTGASNRLTETALPALEGAWAAAETFYHALNERDLDLLRQTWLDDPLVQMNNPAGGIRRGRESIAELYRLLFEGPMRVRVALHDIVVFATPTMVVFAGRERGSYERDEQSFPLEFRTSRVFLYAPEQGGWRQVHHHGSSDDAEKLAHYQQTLLRP